MSGNFLWAWDDSISEWIKVAVDPTGKLEVSGLEFPDDYPLPAAQVTDLKKITEIPDPVISQTTPENLRHVPHGRVAGNGAYLPIQVSAAGKLAVEMTPLAHKDSHDPEDGSDPLDTAAPVKVGAANAIGTSHSLARADHVHEREHAIYTDAAAKAAAVQAGAITDAVTKAPTHDAVYDVKVTADAALPAVDKYTDLEAVAAAKTVKLDDFTVPDDTLDLDATAALHGLMPKADKSKLDEAVATATASKLVIRDASARAKFAAPGAAGDVLIKGTRATTAELPAMTDEKIWKGTGANVEEVDVYTDAKAVDAIEADDNLPVASITFIIDGGGSVITTGIKGALEIPFACTINRVTLLADQSGSIVIDIWKQAYADYPPEDANSIVAAAPPTLDGADHSQDATLTDWTTAIAAGDCLMFNVDSITTCTWVTLSLKVTKT